MQQQQRPPSSLIPQQQPPNYTNLINLVHVIAAINHPPFSCIFHCSLSYIVRCFTYKIDEGPDGSDIYMNVCMDTQTTEHN